MQQGYDKVRTGGRWLLVEGAAGAGELEPADDLANQVLPARAGLPVVLVTNPRRSGHLAALASLTGLLVPELRALLHGFVLNQIGGTARVAPTARCSPPPPGSRCSPRSRTRRCRPATTAPPGCSGRSTTGAPATSRSPACWTASPSRPHPSPTEELPHEPGLPPRRTHPQRPRRRPPDDVRRRRGAPRRHHRRGRAARSCPAACRSASTGSPCSPAPPSRCTSTRAPTCCTC
ncbi:hypothetical protein ACFQ1I_33455 [Kitasatospora arboriphila]